MSLLKDTPLIPARVRAVVGLLAAETNQQASLADVERLVMPGASARHILRDVLAECTKLGLFVQDDDMIGLNPALPDTARDPRKAEDLLPLTLVDLMWGSLSDLAPKPNANDDLGYAAAWYLTLSPLAPPARTDLLDLAHPVTSLAGLTNTNPRDQLLYWLPYLGFAWPRAISVGDDTVVPDPTAYLRWVLPDLLPTGDPKPMAAFLSALQGRCPVFEGGRFRVEVEQITGPRPERTLSPALAHALLRLRDEGSIVLHTATDTTPVLLPDGPETHRILALSRRTP